MVAKERQINIRVDADLHDKLRKLADQDRRSLADYIRLLLENHADAATRRKPK